MDSASSDRILSGEEPGLEVEEAPPWWKAPSLRTMAREELSAVGKIVLPVAVTNALTMLLQVRPRSHGGGLR